MKLLKFNPLFIGLSLITTGIIACQEGELVSPTDDKLSVLLEGSTDSVRQDMNNGAISSVETTSSQVATISSQEEVSSQTATSSTNTLSSQATVSSAQTLSSAQTVSSEATQSSTVVVSSTTQVSSSTDNTGGTCTASDDCVTDMNTNWNAGEECAESGILYRAKWWTNSPPSADPAAYDNLGACP